MTEGITRDVYTIQIQRSNQHQFQSPTCDVCQHGCVHLTSLQVREFTQTGKLPNVCKDCNKEFMKVCRMQIRHLTQPEVQLHVCEICGRSFIHTGNLKKHKLQHHKKESSAQNGDAAGQSSSTVDDPAPKNESTGAAQGNSMEQEDCQILEHESNEACETAEDDNLESQNDKTDNAEEKSLQELKCICKQCNKQFRNELRFTRHCQMHCGKQNFYCGACKKIFENAAGLRAHCAEHEEKGQYICNICFSVFEDFQPLTEHCVKLHNQALNGFPAKEDILGRTIFTCEVCEKIFVQRVAFERHCKLHTGQAQYTCKVCGKGYMQLGRLKVHRRLHKRRSCYSCDICNKTFQMKSALLKHQPTHEIEDILK